VAQPVLRGKHNACKQAHRQRAYMDPGQRGCGFQGGQKRGEQGEPPRLGYCSFYAMGDWLSHSRSRTAPPCH
jgi:hypothetical protein